MWNRSVFSNRLFLLSLGRTGLSTTTVRFYREQNSIPHLLQIVNRSEWILTFRFARPRKLIAFFERDKRITPARLMQICTLRVLSRTSGPRVCLKSRLRRDDICSRHVHLNFMPFERRACRLCDKPLCQACRLTA